MAKGKKNPPGRGIKLTWDDVEAIRKAAAKGTGYTTLAEKYGVHERTIYSIVAHRSWKGKRPSPLKGRRSGRAPANKTVAPAKGKVFKEKVRKAKGKKRSGVPLSLDKYNQMYLAYQETQSAAHVGRVCGVSARVAAKYINQGDPTRNLRPLKDRFDSVVSQAQSKQDYGLEVMRKEMQLAARALFAKAAKRIQGMNPTEIKANFLPQWLKDLQVVLERTEGVADATVQVRGVGRFDNWTTDELMTFFQTGKFPIHDVMAAPTKKSKV